MQEYRCPHCGGTIELDDSGTIGVCKYCGVAYSFRSRKSDDLIVQLNIANAFLRQGDFDSAIAHFNGLYELYPDDAEVAWGCLTSKYGIKYVTDDRTGDSIPTCCRLIKDEINKDEYFINAYKNATDTQKQAYLADARIIKEYQKQIWLAYENEADYDVFISFKSKEKGKITPENVVARKIYDELNNRGLKTFFSDVTLKGTIGSQYEPKIYRALYSCKFFILVATTEESLNAVWVKNEWTRFRDRIKDENLTQSSCIVYDSGKISINSFPRVFTSNQGIDLANYPIGGYEKIIADALCTKFGKTSENKINEKDIEKYVTQIVEKNSNMATINNKRITVTCPTRQLSDDEIKQNKNLGKKFYEDGHYVEAYDLFLPVYQANKFDKETLYYMSVCTWRLSGEIDGLLDICPALIADIYENKKHIVNKSLLDDCVKNVKMAFDTCNSKFDKALKSCVAEYCIEEKMDSPSAVSLCKKHIDSVTNDFNKSISDIIYLLREEEKMLFKLNGNFNLIYSNDYLIYILSIIDSVEPLIKLCDTTYIGDITYRKDAEVSQFALSVEGETKNSFDNIVKQIKDIKAYCKGELYYRDERYFESFGEFNKLSGFNDDAVKKRSDCRSKLDKYDGAVAKYNETLECRDVGLIAIFDSLDKVKDARRYSYNIKRNIYNKGVDLYNSKRYEEAILEFKKIENFEDAKNCIEKCVHDSKQEIYNTAEDYYNDKQYDMAIVKFKEIEDFEDAQYRINKCKYDKARVLFDDEKYDEAVTLFDELVNFEDAVDYASRCRNTVLNEKSLKQTIWFAVIPVAYIIFSLIACISPKVVFSSIHQGFLILFIFIYTGYFARRIAIHREHGIKTFAMKIIYGLSIFLGIMSFVVPAISVTKITDESDISMIRNCTYGNYVLCNDIDMVNEEVDEINVFTGSIDGNGYTIKNFTCNDEYVIRRNHGEIQNITLNYCTVKYFMKSNNRGYIDNLALIDASYTALVKNTNKEGTIKNVTKSSLFTRGITSISAEAYYDDDMLTSVTIPNSVITIGESAFAGCDSLTTVVIPDSVTTIGASCFAGCDKLENVTISKNVTSIGNYAFYNCSSLKSITIYCNGTLGNYAFKDCEELTTVTISSGVTGISSSCFEDCESLTSVTIPQSVTSISSYAFDNCSNLKYIYYSGTISQWQSISKGYNWNRSSGSYTVRCSNGTISK